MIRPISVLVLNILLVQDESVKREEEAVQNAKSLGLCTLGIECGKSLNATTQLSNSNGTAIIEAFTSGTVSLNFEGLSLAKAKALIALWKEDNK